MQARKPNLKLKKGSSILFKHGCAIREGKIKKVTKSNKYAEVGYDVEDHSWAPQQYSHEIPTKKYRNEYVWISTSNICEFF